MNKKRIFSLAVAGTMAFSLLTACGKSPAADSPAASGDGAARTTFTVGFDAEFPPYGYQDEKGEYIGFDLDLAQEVCTRNGWELIKKPIEWASKDLELTSGGIDCIWNGFTMNGREDAYTWSKPYIDNSQVFVSLSTAGINDFAALSQKNIAVQADSSALAALNDEESAENIALRDSFANLQEVPDYNTAFTNLESGAVDAIAMDIGVAHYQLSQRGTDKFKILEQPLASEQYAIGFVLGNEILRDQVQGALDEMVKDGGFQTIVDHWSELGLSADSVILGK